MCKVHRKPERKTDEKFNPVLLEFHRLANVSTTEEKKSYDSRENFERIIYERTKEKQFKFGKKYEIFPLSCCDLCFFFRPFSFVTQISK